MTSQIPTLVHGGRPFLSNRHQVRAALFDVDGVIADTASLHLNAWRDAIREAGLPFPESVCDALRGVSRRGSLELILCASSIDPSSVEPSRLDSIMSRKNEFYVASLSRLSPADVLPGVSRLVESLRADGIGLAAVSASRNARSVLDRLGVADWFEQIVVESCEQSMRADDGSPAALSTSSDRAIVHRFLVAAEGLGESPPRCVVIEDSPANLRLARQWGMGTIGVGTAVGPDDADVSVLTLDDLDLDD
ncbi:MAG: HAD hydrolase-like protein [Phycisphaerae bacterium]|nr:HAD hydrolase-like protein [Phycisphaerae bacterium]